MSKDIRIVQNGSAKQLTNVAKIETFTDDGDTSTWVPKDDVRLAILEDNRVQKYFPPPWAIGFSKAEIEGFVPLEHLEEYPVLHVTENGIFQANNDPNGPFKGYSKIVVEVSGGNTRQISKIVITTLPNTLLYDDGATIDYSGIIVKGYDDNNEYVRDIRFDELVFPKKNAAITEYPERINIGSIVTIKRTVNIIPMVYDATMELVDYLNDFGFRYVEEFNLYNELTTLIEDPYTPYTFVIPVSVDLNEIAKLQSGDLDLYRIELLVFKFDDLSMNDDVVVYSKGYEGTAFCFYVSMKVQNNQLVYSFDDFGIDSNITQEPIHYGKYYFDTSGNHSYSAGSNVNAIVSNRHSIPVQWYRQSDGTKLETYFEIDVNG